MRTVQNNRQRTIFDEVDSGQTFAFENDIFLRMWELKDSHGTVFNAVRLYDGQVHRFTPNQVVYLVNGTFVEGYENE